MTMRQWNIKKIISRYIEDAYGCQVINYGTDGMESFPYPVSGKAVAEAVVSGEVDRGIVICGTGIIRHISVLFPDKLQKNTVFSLRAHLRFVGQGLE